MKLTYKQKLDKIKHLRPIDDIFFEALAEDKDVCEEMLQTIMEKPELKVEEVIVQSSKGNIYGRSVRLDALCTLEDGVKANIEVQRADNDDHLRRVRFNSSLVTVKESNAGDKFEGVIELHMIYITEFDLFNEGKTVYHLNKKIQETGTVIDDGLHEIYVNAAIDDGSDIAELMKCFKSEYVDDPKFPVLSGRVKRLKGTEGGRGKMCKIMEDLINEAVTEAVTEVRKEQIIEHIQKMLKKGKTPEEIIDFCDYTPEEVRIAQQGMQAAV